MGLFRVRRPVPRPWAVALGIAAVLVLFGGYLVVAEVRHAANPLDKLTPTLAQILGAARFSVTPDEFSGSAPLWADLRSTLFLFSAGVVLAVGLALLLGLFIGAWPWLDALTEPVLKIVSYLPPVSLIPLVYLTLGFEERAKMFLIFLAVFIPLVRSTVLRVQAVPEKQVWNAQTLGPSQFEIIWVMLRRKIEPGFLDDVRLSLGTAWVYLIVAELIASDRGLGYRINVASRNLDIAQVLFYLGVIALLAFLMDRALHRFNRWRNRWAFVGA